MADLANLVLHVRPSRAKLSAIAAAEVVALLHGLDASAAPGGPLSEKRGVFWIELPAVSLEAAIKRFPRLGYTCAIHLMVETPGGSPDRADRRVVWRRKSYRLDRLYEEDAEGQRSRAPDRRTFLYETAHGEIRPVIGYRGDGGSLSRRGLPVCDARMLVNLTELGQGAALLDPFAGVGGLIQEAVASGLRTFSVDVDPALRHGLRDMGSEHRVADARELPFADESFDGVAAEPPFHEEAEAAVLDAMGEILRVLRPGGRIALLCAEWQAEGLRRRSEALSLRLLLEAPIDRKGLPCHLLLWRKPEQSR